MKEITSRIWLKTTGTMVYKDFDRRTHEICFLIKDLHKGHIITRDPLSQPYCLLGCGAIDIFKEPDRDCVGSDEYIEEMLSTGLKDKNGKEIYEGDIIQTDRTGIGGEKRNQLVIFSTRYSAFMTTDSEEYNGKSLGHYCLIFTEVIGNIYEHPELLESK